jgi:phosphomethylpyrimidine synthase
LARGIHGAREWDDDLSRARAALNWPRQFELAFDGETARALHHEDLDVDTDFCAMCGHDWCSMRISKEIQEFASGKDERFQPQRPAAPSPGTSAQGSDLLRQRARALPAVGDRRACHSELLPDADDARALQDASANR